MKVVANNQPLLFDALRLDAVPVNPVNKMPVEKSRAEAVADASAFVSAARKFLGIIYNTLKNEWTFKDFPNFVLAE